MTTFPAPPEFWAETRAPEMWRVLSQSVRGLLRGKSNNVRTVTLLPNVLTTVIIDESITADTVALLSPKTANASGEVGIYTISTIGKVTIHHASAGTTDRTFGAVLIG
jgi:hypothetical protein